MLKMKRLKGQSSKAILWNFSGMAFSLVNGIITARLLSPNDRGVLALAITLSTFAFLFSSVGTNVAVRTFQPTQGWASFRTYFYLSMRLVVVDFAIIALLLLYFVRIDVIALNSSVVWIAVLSLATFLSNQLLDTLNAAGLVSYSAMLNTSGHFSTMVMLVIFYFFASSNHVSLAISAYFVGFIIRILVISATLRKKEVPLGSLDRAGATLLLKHGFKFWGVNIGQTITFRADQLLLGTLAGAHSVGIYAVAVTPTTLMQVVSNTLGQFMFRQAALGKLTPRTAIKNIATAFSITLAYGALMWVAAPLLIPFFFGERYTSAVEIVRILLIGELFLSPYLIMVRILSGFNHPNAASWSGLIGLIILVPTMYLLVPQLGASGAAISAVFCYAAMAIWTAVFLVYTFRSQSKLGSIDAIRG